MSAPEKAPLEVFFPVKRGKVAGVVFVQDGGPATLPEKAFAQVAGQWPRADGLVDAMVRLDRKPG